MDDGKARSYRRRSGNIPSDEVTAVLRRHVKRVHTWPDPIRDKWANAYWRAQEDGEIDEDDPTLLDRQLERLAERLGAPSNCSPCVGKWRRRTTTATALDVHLHGETTTALSRLPSNVTSEPTTSPSTSSVTAAFQSSTLEPTALTDPAPSSDRRSSRKVHTLLATNDEETQRRLVARFGDSLNRASQTSASGESRHCYVTCPKCVCGACAHPLTSTIRIHTTDFAAREITATWIELPTWYTGNKTLVSRDKQWCIPDQVAGTWACPAKSVIGPSLGQSGPVLCTLDDPWCPGIRNCPCYDGEIATAPPPLESRASNASEPTAEDAPPPSTLSGSLASYNDSEPTAENEPPPSAFGGNFTSYNDSEPTAEYDPPPSTFGGSFLTYSGLAIGGLIILLVILCIYLSCCLFYDRRPCGRKRRRAAKRAKRKATILPPQNPKPLAEVEPAFRRRQEDIPPPEARQHTPLLHQTAHVPTDPSAELLQKAGGHRSRDHPISRSTPPRLGTVRGHRRTPSTTFSVPDSAAIGLATVATDEEGDENDPAPLLRTRRTAAARTAFGEAVDLYRRRKVPANRLSLPPVPPVPDDPVDQLRLAAVYSLGANTSFLAGTYAPQPRPIAAPPKPLRRPAGRTAAAGATIYEFGPPDDPLYANGPAHGNATDPNTAKEDPDRAKSVRIVEGKEKPPRPASPK